MLVAATLVVLVRLLREREPLPEPSRTILAAWCGSVLLSTLFGLDPLSGLQILGMMALTAIFHLALVRWWREPAVAAAVLGGYLATGSFASLAALVMLLLRRPGALYALNHGRAAGFFVTANQCAAFAMVFVLVAAGVALGFRGPLRRLAGAGAAAGLAVLAATLSQAGWLGAAAGGIFFAWAAGARRVALAVASVAALAAFAALLRPVGGHNPAEAFDRLRIWRAGIRVAEVFPLTGTGPMAYFRAYPAIRPPNGDPPGTFGALHPHDVYLSLADDLGVVGLAAFGLGWLRFARAMRARLRAAPAGGRYLGIGVCAGLIAALVQGVFDTIGIVEMTFVWIPLMALALASVDPAAAEVRS